MVEFRRLDRVILAGQLRIRRRPPEQHVKPGDHVVVRAVVEVRHLDRVAVVRNLLDACTSAVRRRCHRHHCQRESILMEANVAGVGGQRRPDDDIRQSGRRRRRDVLVWARRDDCRTDRDRRGRSRRVRRDDKLRQHTGADPRLRIDRVDARKGDDRPGRERTAGHRVNRDR